MARYRANDASERRTVKVTVQLAPSERNSVEVAAKQQGATLSEYSREQLLRRGGRSPEIADVRRNPEGAALLRELSAIGNNLNQIARHLNTSGDLDNWDELRFALTAHKHAIGRVLDL